MYLSEEGRKYASTAAVATCRDNLNGGGWMHRIVSAKFNFAKVLFRPGSFDRLCLNTIL